MEQTQPYRPSPPINPLQQRCARRRRQWLARSPVEQPAPIRPTSIMSPDRPAGQQSSDQGLDRQSSALLYALKAGSGPRDRLLTMRCRRSSSTG